MTLKKKEQRLLISENESEVPYVHYCCLFVKSRQQARIGKVLKSTIIYCRFRELTFSNDSPFSLVREFRFHYDRSASRKAVTLAEVECGTCALSFAAFNEAHLWVMRMLCGSVFCNRNKLICMLLVIPPALRQPLSLNTLRVHVTLAIKLHAHPSRLSPLNYDVYIVSHGRNVITNYCCTGIQQHDLNL